jgi:mitochondrial import receptor subunit TOM40
MSEKAAASPAPSAFTPYLDTVANLFHPVSGPVMNTYARFHGWKENMGLVQPGTVENLTREVSRQYHSLRFSRRCGNVRAMGGGNRSIVR